MISLVLLIYLQFIRKTFMPKYIDYIFYLINPLNLFRNTSHDTPMPPMKLNTDLRRAKSAPARICTKCKKVHLKKTRKT